MDDTRPILYGVADYAQIRKKTAWFVDRTAKIRDLEATRFLRDAAKMAAPHMESRRPGGSLGQRTSRS